MAEEYRVGVRHIVRGFQSSMRRRRVQSQTVHLEVHDPYAYKCFQAVGHERSDTSTAI